VRTILNEIQSTTKLSTFHGLWLSWLILSSRVRVQHLKGNDGNRATKPDKHIQHNDTQHSETQHSDNQHSDIQHNYTQHKGIICDIMKNDIQHNDTLHNNTLPLC